MPTAWTAEDRAAARSFLQRCEVRLSTLHRVATALLSGAGLMVLLPAMMKDQIAGVVGTLLSVDPSAPHVLLAVIAGIVLVLPLVVFFMLLGDLTRFYFHAHHVESDRGILFVPRFTLTGLRIASDELTPSAGAELHAARSNPAAVELVVPPNAAGRDRIDQRLAAYGLDGEQMDDGLRAAGLFGLISSQSRTLADEVAKVEFGLARHLLRLQVIVIRYVKSLLVFLVTALTVFAAAAVVERDTRVSDRGQLWLAAIFACWAPVVVSAVSSPVRWVNDMLRADGATSNSVASDPEFTRFERVVIAVGAAVLVLAVVVLVLQIVDGATARDATMGTVAIAAAALAFLRATNRSVAGPTVTGHRASRR